MSANGRLPLSSLKVTSTGHRLRGDAAAAFERLRAGFRTGTGRVLSVTDAYRDFAAQVKLRAAKGKFAAVPGTSNHGWGIALDLGSGVNVDTSAEHRWMDAHASEYGWVNPTWARDNNPNNGQYEPWHWEYVPALDQHAGGTLAARPTTTEPPKPKEDPDMGLLIRQASTGATIFVQGGVGVVVHGGGDLENYQGAGIHLVNLSDAGFAAAKARYLV